MAWLFGTGTSRRILFAVTILMLSLGNMLQAQMMMSDSAMSYPAPLKQQRKWIILQERPIDSILFRRQNTRFSKELYNLLIRENAGKPANQKMTSNHAELASKDGKIIRRIEFGKKDIFATPGTDSVYSQSTAIEKALNLLHDDTRHKVLKRHLLFNPGDPLDVFLIAENERILRSLPYINDAQFQVKPIPGSPDSVDLVLLTQDLSPLGFQAEIAGPNTGSASLWHQNLMGLGHQAMVATYWNGDLAPKVGYGLSYGISSLAGKFITAELEYIDRANLNSLTLDVSRDFKISSFNYAGGIRIENTNSRRNIDLLDTTLSSVNVRYTSTDLWAGRMIKLRNYSSRMRTGLFFTGRLDLYENHNGPKTTENYLYPYQDKSLLLFTTGFSKRGFRKDDLIYTFGRTEDVPIGYYLELTGGAEHGQYNTRAYFAASASMGNYLPRSGYLYGQVKFGTFLNGGVAEQGAFQLRLQYFSRLHHFSQIRFRNFINLNYIDGINRFEGEFVSLENRGGIAGLTSASLRGNDKLVLNLESVVFSPIKFMGFRFAFFGSVDLGMISGKESLLQDSRIYSGLRLGLRIRNDRLVFNTFEFSFGMYPGMPAEGDGRYFTAGNLTRMRFNDFIPYKPAIIEYR
jgi:outer membrane protein assembly factor BamA